MYLNPDGPSTGDGRHSDCLSGFRRLAFSADFPLRTGDGLQLLFLLMGGGWFETWIESGLAEIWRYLSKRDNDLAQFTQG